MRGRQILMESLIAQGVSYIFGNPGTTESPIIDSLLDYPQLSYIEALHEGVAVGAASYYAQASGKTGFVNVHVAPGLGNSIGMMYNALKASAPVVVTAGQQDTRMRLRDPLLGHDLVAMAAPVTKWSVQAERADELYNLVSSKGRGLYYKNERVDTLFDLGRGTMDMARRRQIYRDLARAMLDDATWVFLLQQVDIYASRDRLTWAPRSDQWMPLHDASLK